MLTVVEFAWNMLHNQSFEIIGCGSNNINSKVSQSAELTPHYNLLPIHFKPCWKSLQATEPTPPVGWRGSKGRNVLQIIPCAPHSLPSSFLYLSVQITCLNPRVYKLQNNLEKLWDEILDHLPSCMLPRKNRPNSNHSINDADIFSPTEKNEEIGKRRDLPEGWKEFDERRDLFRINNQKQF